MVLFVGGSVRIEMLVRAVLSLLLEHHSSNVERRAVVRGVVRMDKNCNDESDNHGK